MSRVFIMLATIIGFITYGLKIVDGQTNKNVTTFPHVYQSFINIVSVLKNIGENDSLKHLGDLVPKIAVIGVQSAGILDDFPSLSHPQLSIHFIRQIHIRRSLC